MGLFDWLTGDEGTTISYAQSPQQEQVFQAILPLLQRLGAVSTNTGKKNPYLTSYNAGVNPWTGNATTAMPVSRANLGTTSQAYPTGTIKAGTSQTSAVSPDIQQNLLANINRNRILKGMNPITLSGKTI